MCVCMCVLIFFCRKPFTPENKQTNWPWQQVVPRLHTTTIIARLLSIILRGHYHHHHHHLHQKNVTFSQESSKNECKKMLQKNNGRFIRFPYISLMIFKLSSSSLSWSMVTHDVNDDDDHYSRFYQVYTGDNRWWWWWWMMWWKKWVFIFQLEL